MMADICKKNYYRVRWSARYRGSMTVKTAVHHDTHLVSDPLWHIQPMKLIVEE